MKTCMLSILRSHLIYLISLTVGNNRQVDGLVIIRNCRNSGFLSASNSVTSYLVHTDNLKISRTLISWLLANGVFFVEIKIHVSNHKPILANWQNLTDVIADIIGGGRPGGIGAVNNSSGLTDVSNRVVRGEKVVVSVWISIEDLIITSKESEVVFFVYLIAVVAFTVAWDRSYSKDWIAENLGDQNVREIWSEIWPSLLRVLIS